MSLATHSPRTAMEDFLTAAMPATFVFLWSSGFIGAKLGMPYTEPFTFLALRFLLAAAILVPFLVVWRTPWPRSWADAGHITMTGILLNVVCLGSCFYALSLGLPGAIVAVIGGLQPLLTGVLASTLLGEKVTMRQWLGLVLGFGGVVLVLSDKLSLAGAPPVAILSAFMGLAGITAATLYQKRFCADVPLRSGTAIQFATSATVILPVAIFAEGFTVRWTGEFVFALLWLSIALSIGALSLYWLLVRRGEAAKVTSLFYLTPPTTAVMGWLVFGEQFGAIALLGMAIAVAGVALATREGDPRGGKDAPS